MPNFAIKKFLSLSSMLERTTGQRKGLKSARRDLPGPTDSGEILSIHDLKRSIKVEVEEDYGC
jgi:hypothetical protein